jgi:hypothetical protein
MLLLYYYHWPLQENVWPTLSAAIGDGSYSKTERLLTINHNTKKLLAHISIIGSKVLKTLIIFIKSIKDLTQ